ncbi:phenylacetate--CoA ligase family protein [Paucibacter soli]|uniref:phenylacetate--CoA ligase family protein n=1 Tax=Paucibacter soli TaxID=3133433 RepID=UPI0030AE2D61
MNDYSIYTRFVSGVLFPLHEKLKRHDTVAVRRELDASQWWSAAQLQAHQLRRLRELLCEAGRAVPYYRQLFAELGFDPAAIRSLDDLRRLPMLTKPLIRAHSEAMKHPQAQQLSMSSTGGSSGEPLRFYIGRERVSHDVAAKWRATRWWDVDIGDPEVVIWGSPIELGAQDRVRVWRDQLMRSTLLSAFEMSEANLDGYIARIRALRPKMVFGYPYSIAHIAAHAERRGVRLDDLGVRVVFVTSEALHEHQREIISRVFGAPVANGYGGRDAGFIAHECPAGGLHITAEDIIVELLDEAGQPVPDGTPGEVVVTHLCSRDFPFVRYRTGDVAVRATQACACGRGLPMLAEIQGRTNDFVQALDGTLLPCKAFTYMMREIDGIDAFKIIQETLQLTRLQLVRPAGLDAALRERLMQGFRQRLGEGVQIEIELLDHIPTQGNGKYRYVVSHVVGQGASVPGVSA